MTFAIQGCFAFWMPCALDRLDFLGLVAIHLKLSRLQARAAPAVAGSPTAVIGGLCGRACLTGLTWSIGNGGGGLLTFLKEHYGLYTSRNRDLITWTLLRVMLVVEFDDWMNRH